MPRRRSRLADVEFIELRNSAIARLKHKIEETRKKGLDLFAVMVMQVAADIAARTRASSLRDAWWGSGRRIADRPQCDDSVVSASDCRKFRCGSVGALHRQLYSGELKFRSLASIVQLAVFVVGGILGPVWHLAHHQNDHTHGGAPSTGQHHEHSDVGVVALVDWSSPDHDADTSEHAPIVAEGAHAHAPPTAPESDARHTPLDHGRGSVAHLGLVLFGAPALQPVPLSERGEQVPVVAAIATLSLFHPPCPLQRPPPARTA